MSLLLQVTCLIRELENEEILTLRNSHEKPLNDSLKVLLIIIGTVKRTQRSMQGIECFFNLREKRSHSILCTVERSDFFSSLKFEKETVNVISYNSY